MFPAQTPIYPAGKLAIRQPHLLLSVYLAGPVALFLADYTRTEYTENQYFLSPLACENRRKVMQMC